MCQHTELERMKPRDRDEYVGPELQVNNDDRACADSNCRCGSIALSEGCLKLVLRFCSMKA